MKWTGVEPERFAGATQLGRAIRRASTAMRRRLLPISLAHSMDRRRAWPELGRLSCSVAEPAVLEEMQRLVPDDLAVHDERVALHLGCELTADTSVAAGANLRTSQRATP